MQALLNYMSGLNIPGAVLIFLPGWNLIFALHKHLKMHPQFGKTKSDFCLISPLSINRLSGVEKKENYQLVMYCLLKSFKYSRYSFKNIGRFSKQKGQFFHKGSFTTL